MLDRKNFNVKLSLVYSKETDFFVLQTVFSKQCSEINFVKEEQIKYKISGERRTEGCNTESVRKS